MVYNYPQVAARELYVPRVECKVYLEPVGGGAKLAKSDHPRRYSAASACSVRSGSFTDRV